MNIKPGVQIKITRKPDSFVPDGKGGQIEVLRISAGGNGDYGFYLTYRGTLEDVKALIKLIDKALEPIEKELDITPDDDKR